jgi:outer membrane protein OmpA-like peptidoglycan-associated protein
LRIVGHTDASGSAAANDALSLDRAASVRDWLVARGVPAPRISVAGRGARDAGLGGAAGDRRVEILIGEPAVRPSATGR